jgi:hypothetical protein
MRKIARIIKEGQGTQLGSMAKMLIDCCDKIDELEAENAKLVELLKLAYRNWLEDPDVAWAELGEKLCDGLCESMGDVGFQKWMQALKENDHANS